MSIGLLASELRRLTSRRFIRSLVLILFGLVVVVATVAFFQSNNDPKAGLAEAQRIVADCQRQRIEPGAPIPDEKTVQFQCPRVEDLRGQFDHRFNYAANVPDALRGLAIALMSLGILVGASFVGADWGSGVMTTTLTWEPRRGRLLAAKSIVCAATVGAAGFLLLAWVSVVHFPVAAFRGSTATLNGGLWWSMAGIWLRGGGLAAFGSLLGISLATLFRNTAGSAGFLLFYTAVLDQLLAVMFKARFRVWTLQHNANQLVGFPVQSAQARGSMTGGVIVQDVIAGITRPIVLLSIYAAFALAIAYGVFRTRDVT